MSLSEKYYFVCDLQKGVINDTEIFDDCEKYKNIILYSNSTCKEWWIEDKKVTEEEFKKALKKNRDAVKN